MSEPEYCVWKGESYKLRVVGERVMFWNPEGHSLNYKVGVITGLYVSTMNEGALQSCTVDGIGSGSVSNNYLVDAPPENFTPPEIEEWLRG